MKWTERKSQKGRRNGWKSGIGPIGIEVFRDYKTHNWVLKLPGLGIRVTVCDPSTSQREVILDMAEKALMREVRKLRAGLAVTLREMKAARSTESVEVEIFPPITADQKVP